MTPSTSSGELTSSRVCSGSAPGSRTTVTSAVNSRGAPSCSPPRWYAAVKSSRVNENGGIDSSLNALPGLNESNCARVLANDDPSRTITVPRKPPTEPSPTAASSTSSARWKTRLPVSRA